MSSIASAQNIWIDTNQGRIELELYSEKAPLTVENFLRYVEAGHYEGTIFHRVIPGFMIQGGGYNTAYQKKATRDPIRNEANNGLSNQRGTIAMARTSDPHSASAQFFINHADNSSLDHRGPTPAGWGYAVFGRVIDGMSVVDRIAALDTGAVGPFRSDVPLTPVIIQSIRLFQEPPDDEVTNVNPE